jgi:hypothetical protein
MRQLISRFTMKCLRHSFNDIVTGEGVYVYVDKYGDEYLSNYPFWFWCFRVKRENKNEKQ